MRLALLLLTSLLIALNANAQQPTQIRYDFGEPSMSGSHGTAATLMNSKGLAVFEDSDIAVTIGIARMGLLLEVENISQSPIRLDWNECAYIDPAGHSRRVIHSGVRLVDREAPMAATIIPPHAVHSTSITPSDTIQYSAILHKWEMGELLPDGYKYLGKTLGVFLPLQVNGVKRDYSFSIKIRGIR